MEGDGESDQDLTPFWLQSTTSLRRVDRLRHRLSSIFFSSGIVVILLLVTAVFFLALVVPSTLSLTTSHIFRPNSVKKSWDSLNIVLVLAAVVFGFLSRNKNGDRYYYDEYQSSPVKQNETPKSNHYDYSDNEAQKLNQSTVNQYQLYDSLERENKIYRSGIIRRTSSSYPDLLEFSVNWSSEDDRRRYYDDMYVDSYRISEVNQLRHRRRRSLEDVDQETEQKVKNIYVDTITRPPKEVSDAPFPPPPAVLPPPSPPSAQEAESVEKPNRTYESVARKRERPRLERNLEPIAPPAVYPSPPPPPPPPPVLQSRNGRSDRKRGGTAGSATKEFINSLYHKKKKKQRQKSVDNLDSLVHQTQPPPLHYRLPQPSPPPPPPPPPPAPPSVFHSLFSSKKPKRKTRHVIITPSNPAPIPPPPPPPPPKAELEPKHSAQIVPIANHKHQELEKNSFENADETSNSSGESPMMKMPPPPPFFKGPAWKFVVQGDYVRINSNASSRSGSPEPDEVDSDVTPSSVQGGEMSPFHPSPAFCPSPDVDTKAESFITNFRANLKLEKVHSINKREVGLSNLGPGPGPS